MTGTRVHRRQCLKPAAAAGAATACFAPALAQGAGPRVVIIGGGFGGTGCAPALRQADSRKALTPGETNAAHTAPPQSNAVIAGLIDLSHQQFGYDKVKAAGIDVVISAATAIDPAKRTVTLANGSALNYDR